MNSEQNAFTATRSSNNRHRRGIYLLPNLLTTAGLFAGFYAIVAAINDRFETAAIAIFIAMLMDGIDGRIARLTNTQSAFGAEYDSLSDMVSFGLGPALIVYEWTLHDLGKIGWSAAFFYTACAALRLARFNTQVGVIDKRYFQGLASPSAAACLAGLVWFATDTGIDGTDLVFPAFILTILMAILMVSNIRYHSFRNLNNQDKVPFMAIFGMVLVFILISSDPPKILFIGFLLYALSGPLITLVRLRQHQAQRHTSLGSADQEDSKE
ncbi:CDP-diacylglycerol/serine O-phosphatidyltransferase [Candidatus Nitrosoglobus terrae]|uniref:CDP-diacylglycerol--serine O-phosphatidyltransferase n=1 Tax=Candidatus Nitrosoglobus terrae TaxID=1630141 RepID=A0A1Q2SP76_9GAMM|nr:CDP-diacylglycerol--serine O-phosphatidyltransferase [Candidatus Nitrosoglobus terrae]BAW80897.1 CDP-diacylglycerol/serine O-phosphatidyltransferase [Candidatus Nitrosoglobus terrae]